MKWIIAVTFAFCLILLAAGCVEDRPTDGYVPQVSGTVTDSLTGLPIDGAAVRWPDTTGTLPDPRLTDSAGRYRIPLYGMSTTVYVQKVGYYTKWKEVVNVMADVGNCDFQLVPE